MKTRTFATLLLAAITATAAPARARAAAPAAAGNAPDAATETTEFQLKNRSTFAAGDGAHNPFWPIGWTKTSRPVAAAAAAAVTLKPDSFEVTSIMLNDPPMAVVNGRAVAEGEIIPMPVGNQKVIVQLAAVQDGQIVIRYQNQNIVVPLRRRGEAAATRPQAPASTATARR